MTVSLCCAGLTRKWLAEFRWRIRLAAIEHRRALLEKREHAFVRIRGSARGIHTDPFGGEQFIERLVLTVVQRIENSLHRKSRFIAGSRRS